MKRSICILSSLVLCFSLYAQTPPAGWLCVQGGPLGIPDQIGLIQFSAGTYYHLDSVAVTDLANGPGKTIMAANDWVRIYDPITRTLVDSITGQNAKLVAIENNHLVVISTVAPYFRVFDNNAGFPLLYSLDSTKVGQSPYDLLIRGDRAYLCHDSSVSVVDLTAQDTLTSIPVPMSMNWPGAHKSLTYFRGDIMVQTDYFTGAPRFSISAIDSATHQVRFIQEAEIGIIRHRPVAADDPFFGPNTVFFNNYDDHYDPILDTLVLSSDSINLIALASPDHDGGIFVGNTTNMTVHFEINGSSSAPVNLPFNAFTYHGRSVWIEGLPLNIEEEEPENARLLLSPNPATTKVTLSWDQGFAAEHVKVISMDGKVVYEAALDSQKSKVKIPVENWENGLYLISVHTRDRTLYRRFTKQE